MHISNKVFYLFKEDMMVIAHLSPTLRIQDMDNPSSVHHGTTLTATIRG